MTDQNNQQAQDQTDGNAAGTNANDQDQGAQTQAAEHNIPRARLNQEIGKRKAAEEALANVAAELKKDIPEEYASLVPDLPPEKLISWIREANAKGLFNPKSPDGIDTKRPGAIPALDMDNMSPLQMREAGYK